MTRVTKVVESAFADNCFTKEKKKWRQVTKMNDGSAYGKIRKSALKVHSATLVTLAHFRHFSHLDLHLDIL